MSTAPSLHSRFAPSGAEIWASCTGAPNLLGLVTPLVDNDEDTAEGNAAHDLLARHMTEGLPLEVNITRAANGLILDAEMMSAIELFRSACHRPVNGTEGNEVPVRMPSVHPDCWGTLDRFAYDIDSRHLYIDDFKYGHGLVSEFENPQLLLYAIGICDSWEPPADLKITLTVVQPRCYVAEPVRRWTLSLSELRQWARHFRSRAEESAQGGELTVGKHCKHCRARHGCRALRLAGLDAIDKAQETRPDELSPAEASMELRILTHYQKLMAARVSGLEEQCKAAIQAGKNVPDWMLGSTRRHKQWTRPDTEIIAIGEALGLALAKPPAAITPTQAEQAGFPADLLPHFSERPQGSLKLIPFNSEAARRALSK